MQAIPDVILVGGFLGAGKTTLVAEMVRRFSARGLRVGVVTNDQAAGLVDTPYLGAQGARVNEVAGGCFCCCFNDFMARLGDLQQESPAEVLIGEPVGSCTDLAATVVRPLQQLYADRFRTAPYSVLVDPLRWRQSLTAAQWPLTEQTLYLYRLQIDEADAIVLSKCDLLGAQERQALLQELARIYPGRPIFAISALTGEGVGAWLAHVLSHSAAGQQRIDVDYDRYAQGEADLGWLNLTATLTSAGACEWAAFCSGFLASLRKACQDHTIEIAHAKLMLIGDGQFVLGNLSALAATPTVGGVIHPLVHQVSLTLNLRAAAAPEGLTSVALATLDQARPPTATLDVLHHACFRPGRPSPTHRAV
jgi:G3E family GTPase